MTNSDFANTTDIVKENGEFMDAMRNYIKPQIDLTIPANQKCAWCKSTKDVKVNYKYGFDLIVHDCLSLCKEDEIPTSFDYDIDNSAIFTKEDEWFADDWYLIHEADPTVELLCPECTLDFNTIHYIIT